MENLPFSITESSRDGNHVKLVMEPMRPGFGQTIGNSLRRVLLSYLQGAAVTSIKVAGVQHQFTSLKGLREDIVDLILNVKQIKVSYSGEEPVTLRLKATGPGPVTADQIEPVSGVEIVNPDLVLANLADEKSNLDVTLTVESGVGYSPAEDRHSTTVGEIPVDAIFSPIVRVNYKVSSTRVGRLTNYDQLVLDIWSDGTIDAMDAVVESAKIVRSMFDMIINPQSEVVEPETESESETEYNEAYRLTVEELELPTRIANALRKSGLGTVKDLVHAPKAEIIKVKNLGGKSMSIIEDALRDKGVDWSS